MPGKKLEQSIQIREWVKTALEEGANNPAQVQEWIDKNKNRGEETPVISTINRIMRDMGYRPVESAWVKDG